MHRIAALLLVFVVLAAACGGDDTAVSGGGAAPEPTVEGAGAGDDTAASGEGVTAPTPVRTDGPQVGDHWHSAYGIYLCDGFVDPFIEESDPEGIHTHSDGVIHIHPFVESAAEENATMGKFFDAVGVELRDDGFSTATDSLLVSELDCGGEPAVFTVARWSLYGLDQEPAIVESGFADIRFLEDLEVYTLALAPVGADIPPPPWVANLGSISDVDPSEVPELPAGFTVAAVPPPPDGESVSGETDCPNADGSSPRVTEFDRPPPTCIDRAVTYTATFVTNYGDVVVELDAGGLPETVNNFVVLARYHYYDDTALFRTAPSIAIIQGGAPHTNTPADPGPGYTIADEADGFSYEAGDLAMARTAQPDSASAQFFFSAGPETANLDGPPGNDDGSGRGTYVVFGRTVDGLDVLEEILGLHVEDPRLNGGGPGVPVIVEQVLITES